MGCRRDLAGTAEAQLVDNHHLGPPPGQKAHTSLGFAKAASTHQMYGGVATENVTHDPSSLFQKGTGDEWVEPGTDVEWPSTAVWEFLIGSYERFIPDEERQVWVIWDAAAQMQAPAAPRLHRRLRDPRPVACARIRAAWTVEEARNGIPLRCPHRIRHPGRGLDWEGEIAII